jgi:phage FluMu gp28-like protein
MKVIGFSPRPDQLEVLTHPARFRAMDCGRRWGKTITESNWLDEGAINEGGENWFLSPIYAQSKAVFREKVNAARRGGADAAFKDVSVSELRIEYKTGGVEHFKSADNPETLRGAGLKRVVIDEAARVKRDVWEEVIRPAVSDTHGKVLFGTTPKGKNWFYELWTRGQDGLHPEYKSWKFPTSANPLIPASDIEQARQTLPVDVFAQEYLAEFLDNNAGVFRNVKACIGSQREEPVSGRSYYAGLDLARLTDFTVLTIVDADGRQIFHDRFNLLDWAVQKERVIHTCTRYGAQLLIDSTGIGDPIFDDLQRAGLAIDGYKFTADSKKKLIEALMIAFEQKKIRIIDDAVQANELDIYEYNIGSSGIVHYSAPEGYHDDCVIALALAWWAKENSFMPMIWRVK